MLDIARRVIEAQPFSAILGTRVLSMDRGRASLGLRVNSDLRQQYGFVHGGVLAYLVDNAITFAAGAVLGDGVVTVEMKVNYLRPASGEGELVAEASVIGSGRSQAVCRCDVHLQLVEGERTLVAAGQGTVRVASTLNERRAAFEASPA